MASTLESNPELEKDNDPFLWLEDIEGEKSLEWVKSQNKKSLSMLQNHPEYKNIYDKTLEFYQSTDKIPVITIQGDYVYNFWQDSVNIKGVIRRTTIKNYRNVNPKWEIILNMNKLPKIDGENWVYGGSTWLYPNYDRVFMYLRRGGSDACVIREFDTITKKFIDDGGFRLNEAKSSVVWIDIDHIYITTDFGEGSLNKSGYPRIVKMWTRNTPLEHAETIFETSIDDANVGIITLYDNVNETIKYTFIVRNIDFYNKEYYLIENNHSKMNLRKIILPSKCCILGLSKNQLIVSLQEDWSGFSSKFLAGSVCSFDLDYQKALEDLSPCAFNMDYRNKLTKYHATLLFEPSSKTSFSKLDILKNSVMVTTMENIVNVITEYDFDSLHSVWKTTGLKIPSQGSLSITCDDRCDYYYVEHSDFLTPSRVYERNINNRDYVLVKQLPVLFDASNFKVVQKEARSKDGTMIPYFMVYNKNMVFINSNPTLMYGYGGFEISEIPYYLGIVGNSWLKYGGVYVIANIRGGGEFGPSWHQSALKEKRMRCYEDFIGIAENLIEIGVTNKKKFGIFGGSNGGLLVSAVTMLRPDLFNAVFCAVPLTDMKRYHLLLAGNSWIGEYGDPDDADMWKIMKTYSPYQNIKCDETYPMMMFTSSTNDDRVHPGHARKMVAKMQSMNHNVLYYENTEGGHGGTTTDSSQRTMMATLIYVYMLNRLMNNTTTNAFTTTGTSTKRKRGISIRCKTRNFKNQNLKSKKLKIPNLKN